MRTETIKIYTFDELTEKAKEKAIQEYRESQNNYFWDMLSDELEVIKHTGEAIGATKTDYSFDLCGYSYVDFIFSNDFQREMFTELTGVRAMKYIFNNWIAPQYKGKFYWKGKIHGKSYHSKVTKVYHAIDGYWNGETLKIVYDEFCQKVKEGKKPTVDDFIKDLEEQLCKEYMQQAEYFDSDEGIREHISINNYEYYENGEQYA